ncbi:MAG: hypothetical protein OEM02_00160, partial [Desulfobulbaceae bacterium]|nr:hypothetical protein [Desulfobulbaceae bacterium]
MKKVTGKMENSETNGLNHGHRKIEEGVPMSARMRKQGDRDLSHRSITGVLSYALAWLLVVIGTDISRQQPLFVYTIGLLLLLIGLLRLLMVKFYDNWYGKSPGLWRRWFGLGMISSAALWSFFAAWVLSRVGLTTEGLIILLPLIMICAGGVTSLAPNQLFFQVFFGVILLPQIIVLITYKTAHAYLIAVMLFLFGIFIFITAKSI